MIDVFHCVHAYLFPTENWCYQIFRNLPDTRIHIVTECLRGEDAFPLPNAEFLVAPLPRELDRWPWPLRKGLGLLKRLAMPLWQRALIAQARGADLLHAHFATVGWQYQWLAEKSSRPLIVSFYGYDYEWVPRNRPEWREYYRLLFDKAALFITEGEAGRAQLIKAGCRAEKIRVAHLGVDVGRIPFVERKKERNQLRLIQVATFAEKKGQDTTVRAFVRAAPDCPGLTLTFVGKDADGRRPPLERRLADAGLSERVRFIDFVPFAELHAFLRDYHVFIHPSRHSRDGDSEGGAPIVLLDAQATGMPVLATRHCDIPEEVLDGETGLLVDEDDDAALALAIRRFYEMDGEAYARFGQKGRRHVEEHYEAKGCARRLRAIYGELLGER
jgi:colanic acid/amylovoran biosynthesis glycosyltransferase